MHYGRITTVVGSVLAIIGFGLKSASSDAEGLMPALNAATAGAIPDGFDRVVTAMWNKGSAGTAIFLIALVAVLFVTLLPNMKEAMSRMNALVVTVLGVVLMVIGGIAASNAFSDASDLQDAFGAMAAGGQLPQAFAVTLSYGWYMLPLGGVIAAIGGVLQLIVRADESAVTE